jgi:uncharacterized protein (DUF849 family)
VARDVILTCAVTGGGETVSRSPHVPVTPAQIAESALGAASAGAAIVHLHVRDPETGKPSMDGALYAETVSRIRERNPDILINLTTGAGARLIPSLDTPGVAEPGSSLTTPATRTAHIEALRPDICSLDIATMNFGGHAFINTPAHIRAMAKTVQGAGVLPELEVFDLGHLRLAKALIEDGTIAAPFFFQLCLGVPWGAEADEETLDFMVSRLPAGATWSGFGIGARQFPMVEAIADRGGHVRVGLEDNLYLTRGVLAESNSVLVDEAVRRVERMGHRVATPAKAKDLLTRIAHAA